MKKRIVLLTFGVQDCAVRPKLDTLSEECGAGWEHFSIPARWYTRIMEVVEPAVWEINAMPGQTVEQERSSEGQNPPSGGTSVQSPVTDTRTCDVVRRAIGTIKDKRDKWKQFEEGEGLDEFDDLLADYISVHLVLDEFGVPRQQDGCKLELAERVRLGMES